MHATRIDFIKFKGFADRSIELVDGLTIVAGANNVGKSSLLQGLAVWEFCKVATVAQRGKDGILEDRKSSQGFGLGDDEFSPINIPSLKHLWHGLRSQKTDEDFDGYTLEIILHWTHGGEDNHLGFALALANDRLFIKVSTSDVTANSRVPSVAYLPPFAGISAREERLRGAARRRKVGEGLAGAVLRNLLLDMRDENLRKRNELRGDKPKISDAQLSALRSTDPWEILQQTLREVFAAEVIVRDFDEEYHTYIQATVDKGKVAGRKLTRYPKYLPRDLMVEGSGFLQWLSVYTLATSPDADLLLFDEPDAHLHASLQAELVSRLEGVASKFNKQVLLATHSAEIIREAQLGELLEIQRGGTHRYLTSEHQKVGMMLGIGSHYAPRLDRVRASKRVFFHEGSSDLTALKHVADLMGMPWPSNVVSWQTSQSHKERKTIWRAMRAEYGDVGALSLRDRDEEHRNTVGGDFEDKGQSDDGFSAKKWRRRHLESYLIIPSAIARATGAPEADVIHELEEEFGLKAKKKLLLKADAPVTVQDLNGKDILQHFNTSAVAVSQSLELSDVADDLKTMVEAIRIFAQPAAASH